MKKLYKQAPEFIIMNLGADVVLASGGDNFIAAGSDWMEEGE